MTKNAISFLLLFVFLPVTRAQTGGDNVYEFLNLTHSALVSSLGGQNVSVVSDNLSLAVHNPGLLNNTMSRGIALNYVNYFAGINYGQAIYSFPGSNARNFAAGVTYLNYGSFTEADGTGLITGEFTASEYAFMLIFSREIDSMFSIGIDVKPVLSHLESYTSFGFAVDAGISWHNPLNSLSAGLVLRNMGLQVTSYAGEARQKLPFEVQAGITGKPQHAPFRVSLTLRHLEKFDLTHEYGVSPADNTRLPAAAENILRHAIFGMELLPHKNFYVSGGYNYQRRSELKIEGKSAAVGFSWGFGINTSWMDIGFGRATYHLAGSSNHISLVIKPENIFKKSRS